MEFEEEGRRKAPLHAHESAEEKTGRTSQGLALEQLFILLEFQTGVDPRRPRPLNRNQIRKSQTLRPFENPRRNGHPKIQRLRHPPGIRTLSELRAVILFHLCDTLLAVWITAVVNSNARE